MTSRSRALGLAAAGLAALAVMAAAPSWAEGKRYGLSMKDARQAVEDGEGSEALAFYERAAAALEPQGKPTDAALALANAVDVARLIGAFQRGIRAGERALELFAVIPGAHQLVGRHFNTLIVLGQCYRMTGALADARRIAERAQALGATMGSPVVASLRVASAQRLLATIALRGGDLATAAAHVTDSIQALETVLAGMPRARQNQDHVESAYRNLADALGLLGSVEIRRGRPDAAEAAFRKALALAKQTGSAEHEGDPLVGLARAAAARGDWAGAIRQYERAEPIVTRLGRVPSLIAVKQGLARALFAQGRMDDALAAARRAIALVEGVRGELAEGGLRSGYVEDKQDLYETAIRIALAAGKPDEAFAFAESSRARAFLDLLGSQTTLSKGRTAALADDEIRLRNRLRSAQDASEDGGPGAAARVKEAERAYQAFLERVRKENREQASLMTVDPVTLAEVQRLLPEGTTLLEYLVASDHLLIWVIERDRVEVARATIGRAALITAVREFRDAIGRQEVLPQLTARAQRLYEAVFGVARPHIRHERVVIVPHDVLHYLPFAALRSPEGRWLVDDYTLATMPSASVLRYVADKGRAASERVLAIGNPDVGAALTLRYAEREARLVGQRFPKADVLIRAAATKARAKALGPTAGLIHFAVHGELNEADPMASALLLVPQGDDGGRLEVREIFGLDLHARLVVLSACETGLGRLSRGDELVGLQRAFLYAGTPAVMTTLWKVDDRASYELVRAFYDRLPAMDPARALQGAQIETAKAFAHPFAWAAFGLTGPAWGNGAARP